MGLSISFVGVHGIGKTTTAKYFSRKGFKLRAVEAIHLAYGLEPVQRQTLFFTKYVSDFLLALNKIGNNMLVFDSHPLVVLPYTEYWLRKSGLDKKRIEEVVLSFSKIIELLPKVDLLVFLKTTSFDTVVERILSRDRFSSIEEIDRDYIRFIDERIGHYLRIYKDVLAKDYLEINGTLEITDRAKIVESWLMKKQVLVETR